MFDDEKGNAQVRGQEVPKSQEENKNVPEIKPVETPRVGSLGAFVIIATILSMVSVGVLYLANMSKTNQLEKKTTELDQIQGELNSGDLAKLQNDILEIMAGKDALGRALDNRIYWSKFWSELNSATPKNVYYNSLSVDKQGTINVSGEAASLSAVAKLMVSLQRRPVFSSVELSNSSIKESGGKNVASFSMTLKVNQALLANK